MITHYIVSHGMRDYEATSRRKKPGWPLYAAFPQPAKGEQPNDCPEYVGGFMRGESWERRRLPGIE